MRYHRIQAYGNKIEMSVEVKKYLEIFLDRYFIGNKNNTALGHSKLEF
jgi:hypothetical protein